MLDNIKNVGVVEERSQVVLGVEEARLDFRRIVFLHGAETRTAIDGLVHELVECLLLLGVAGMLVRGTGLAQGGTGGLGRSRDSRSCLVLLGHGGGSVKLEGHVGEFMNVLVMGRGLVWIVLLLCVCVFDVWR